MKPILFNTEMVRAILDGRKTVTRRVVKPLPPERFIQAQDVSGEWFFNDKLGDNDMMAWWPSYEKGIAPPYRSGDILYVRETWNSIRFGNGGKVPFRTEYWYKADDKLNDPDEKWRPSIHMPREAARIFLRVTDVRVERLQDSFFKHGSTIFSLQREGIEIGDQCRECIETYGSPCCIDDESECGVLDEVRGAFADLWNRCYAKPRPVKDENGIIDHYESYPWEDIQETRTYRGKPWYVIGNPWVWVIEFERISKEAALSLMGGFVPRSRER